MITNIRTISIFILSFLVVFNFPVFAGINYPQNELRIEIRGDNHLQLKKYFSPLWELPEEFDTKIADLLVTLLPKQFDKASKEMISQWGKPALKGASKVARVLFLKNFNPSCQQILLSYTWFSTAQGFGDKYYDERFAVLTLLDTISHLDIYPAVNPCKKCPELNRIGKGDEFRIGGQPALAIYFNVSNANPCCDTSHIKDEVYTKYFLLTEQGVKECLTLLQERSERFHSRTGTDSTANYTAVISYNKDANDNIREIFSEYSTFSNDQMVDQRILRYVWNAKKTKFELSTR
jgi:hypothetical protein